MQRLLILSRKKQESILIGKNIIIKILEVEGDRVKIGIEAPKDMKVLRKELYEDIREENKQAMNASKDKFDKLFQLF